MKKTNFRSSSDITKWIPRLSTNSCMTNFKHQKIFVFCLISDQIFSEFHCNLNHCHTTAVIFYNQTSVRILNVLLFIRGQNKNDKVKKSKACSYVKHVSSYELFNAGESRWFNKLQITPLNSIQWKLLFHCCRALYVSPECMFFACGPNVLKPRIWTTCANKCLLAHTQNTHVAVTIPHPVLHY